MDAFVARELAAEFPGLDLLGRRVDAAPRRSPAPVRAQLDDLSNRWRGPQAIALRAQPVAQAHRIFFRHVGIDPDVHRVPQEAAVVRRLLDGGFRSHGLPADALTLAVMETGVGVWALDAERVSGPLELRAGGGEDSGDGGDGTLVVADRDGIVAPLFHEPPRERAPSRSTRTLLLYAVRVPGVPPLFAQEALDLAVELLSDEE
jgi:DNA/RNA-binding domain of Phe-tRNA-synthetase-like protein